MLRSASSPAVRLPARRGERESASASSQPRPAAGTSRTSARAPAPAVRPRRRAGGRRTVAGQRHRPRPASPPSRAGRAGRRPGRAPGCQVAQPFEGRLPPICMSAAGRAAELEGRPGPANRDAEVVQELGVHVVEQPGEVVAHRGEVRGPLGDQQRGRRHGPVDPDLPHRSGAALRAISNRPDRTKSGRDEELQPVGPRHRIRATGARPAGRAPPSRPGLPPPARAWRRSSGLRYTPLRDGSGESARRAPSMRGCSPLAPAPRAWHRPAGRSRVRASEPS